MSSTDDTKEAQAFPTTRDSRYGPTHVDGMTLREHYVGLFMAALISHCGPEGTESCVRIAREYADAAIKDRCTE